MKWAFFLLILSTTCFAQKNPYGDLTAEEQKYYKNEMGQGMNQLERIDSTVREINKLHGEIANLKAEVQTLKKEVEELKKGK
jgi:cell division protein FtsB